MKEREGEKIRLGVSACLLGEEVRYDGGHTNVLQHLAGFFTRGLDAPSRAELAGLIREYRRGLVPLVVPLTLVKHWARRLGLGDLAGQVYLNPHPKELMLRNHA
ncbi:MAG: DUF1722 domain-containing protein [candidate division NC10 bacterium]|jgi:uncharacterized protein YbgA (DUF1722 family)